MPQESFYNIEKEQTPLRLIFYGIDGHPCYKDIAWEIRIIGLMKSIITPKERILEEESFAVTEVALKTIPQTTMQ